eukprot:EG_transcript_9324
MRRATPQLFGAVRGRGAFSSTSAMAGRRFPPYFVLHADINETAVAGDGAKGYSAEETLRLVASKYIASSQQPNSTYYKVVEGEMKGKEKHHIEREVLRRIETDSGAVETEIRDRAQIYRGGCEAVDLPDGRTILVLRTFLNLLRNLQHNEATRKAVCVLRTNGPDMGDLLVALRKLGVLQDDGQWRGYGELSYSATKADLLRALSRQYEADDESSTVTINNYTKPPPDVASALLDLAKLNRPLFTARVLFNAGFDPARQDVRSQFPAAAATAAMPVADFPGVVQAAMAEEAAPRLQFFGLREVFAVWQRHNRHHAKPFLAPADAAGDAPHRAIEVFLDDNAYEEVPKGRPGPYIVTVFKPRPGSPGQWATAPVDGTFSEVVRPDKERAYLDPTYYETLLHDACATLLASPSH